MDISQNENVKTVPIYRSKNRGLIGITNNYKKSVGSELTSELLPFKGCMLRQLQKRGYNIKNMPFKTVVPLYFNEFVTSDDTFQPIDIRQFENNPIFKFSKHDNLNGDVMSYKNRDYFLQVSGIVDNIIEKFKTSLIKKRIARSERVNHFDVMSSDEVEQANTAAKVERDLKNKFENSQPLTIKAFKTIVITALIFWLLLYLFE